MNRLGGFDQLFLSLPADFLATSMARMDLLLNTVYKDGVGMGEKSFSFSADEIKTIESNYQIYLAKFIKEYRKSELKVLAGISLTAPTKAAPDADEDGDGDTKPTKQKFVSGELSDQLGTFLNKKSREVVLTTTGEFITASVEVPKAEDAKDTDPKTTTKIVKLPIFTESTEGRITAAGFLGADRSQDLDWMVFERTTLHDDVAQMITDAFGGITIDQVGKLVKLPKEVLQWLNDNQKVLAAIK